MTKRFFAGCAVLLLMACAGQSQDVKGIGGDCGAADLQDLVGQPESVLQTMRFAGPVRVIHPGQAVTMDFSPARLNIIIDEQGKIAEVRCG